jgi:hypothetical protein
MENSLVVKVVKYLNQFFVWYKNNESGFAQLVDVQGNKFSGTPHPTKLAVVKEIKCKEYNHNWYFMTKIGCFSATTGRKIVSPKVVGLFK